jgi:hypothetical protein
MHAFERQDLLETIDPLPLERRAEVLGDPIDGASELVGIAGANLERAPSLEHFGAERR